ncbi:Nucleolar GTP-binding protein 2 [Frankliniella fusca]|uniref:Nucleolar GTP-binding protein 2 n=1 Tax=Frankliniella fusca TaxID=407009 RepID=A0AAE1H6Q4_9NEOP|nr:Nucleolar GTP-binding protein 2 [Frankliniella fusca]
MSNIILVQHFSGYPNDDPASVSRMILCYSAQPMPHGVLEQFPEPRIVELVPAAHHQHPPPAIMAGFDFEGFELPEELQSDEEESDSSSSSAEESDSALDDSPSLSDLDSDSDSVSSPFLLMCATVSWMSCIVRLTQNGYILCISSCLGGSPLSKSSGVLMGAPNITS